MNGNGSDAFETLISRRRKEPDMTHDLKVLRVAIFRLFSPRGLCANGVHVTVEVHCTPPEHRQHLILTAQTDTDLINT